jgi:hypothetical protein
VAQAQDLLDTFMASRRPVRFSDPLTGEVFYEQYEMLISRVQPHRWGTALVGDLVAAVPDALQSFEQGEPFTLPAAWLMYDDVATRTADLTMLSPQEREAYFGFRGQAGRHQVAYRNWQPQGRHPMDHAAAMQAVQQQRRQQQQPEQPPVATSPTPAATSTAAAVAGGSGLETPRTPVSLRTLSAAAA